MNGPIIHLIAEAKILGIPSLIPHFISHPTANPSPNQVDSVFTMDADQTAVYLLHIYACSRAPSLVTALTFHAPQQPPQHSSHQAPLQMRLDHVSSIILLLSVVQRLPITLRGKSNGLPVLWPWLALRPHFLPLSLLLAAFQLCQPSCCAPNMLLLSPRFSYWGANSPRCLCNSYLSSVMCFFRCHLLRDSTPKHPIQQSFLFSVSLP